MSRISFPRLEVMALLLLSSASGFPHDQFVTVAF